MPEDILEKLRAKEEEMEALINDARKKAAIIREGAAKTAKELKADRIREIEEELKRISSIAEVEMQKEVARIEEQAQKDVEDIRKKGAERKDKAVKEVIKAVLESMGAHK
ncbi:MAG: hypothetical protein HYS21_11170 [Deltaproteobacteria bacterium]|nr:hypothetical protein [Deltaproteobacteria bacterium]